MKRIHTGCPIWSCSAWKGTIYPANAPQRDYLKHYSSKFNTVEGNSTFYAIPTADTFRRWADNTSDGFKFALKFPRAISHEHRLAGANLETKAFLDGLSILAKYDRLGPTFLQLGPDFSPQQFPSLVAYLNSLTNEFPFAVEVRNLNWFEEPSQSRLNQLLESLGMDRVIFDSRPLYSMPPGDESESRSQGRKPRSPVDTWVTGKRPMLRLIGRNNLEQTKPWIEKWTSTISDWLLDGLEPFVFCHTPDDRFAPEMTRELHRRILEKLPNLEPLPEWEVVESQKTLF